MRINLHRLLEVSTTDPEDARRRKLLNILLTGVGLLSVLVLLGTAYFQIFWLLETAAEVVPIYVAGTGLFLATIGIFAINRYVSGTAASIAFLILWMIILPFIDTPAEVAAGRSLFVFTIPIVISSVLLKPYSAFIFAILSDVEVSVLAAYVGEVPNVPALLGFMMIALVSWLSARSLESALREVVTINRELDQRVIERTLALSEALIRERSEAGRNQAVLESIADGVVVLDRGGQVIVANPSIEPLVGRSPDNLLGQSLNGWLSQAALEPQDREMIQGMMTNPSQLNGNCKVDWGKKTLAISVAPVKISGGELIGRVAVFHDFTREAQLDRMKDDFLAMVSHELRTPLNSVMGYADMLREGLYGVLAERQVSIINRVMANTQKLLSLVNDLLDQAQIESGHLSFHKRAFSPQELIDYARGVMEGIIYSKNLELVTYCSEDLPKLVYNDPQRLNQVMINLVNNAVKFTEKGQIKVSLLLVDGAHWSIVVADTGVGIPPEAHQYIFEPFRQVDAEVTNRPKGIGLGLSIVKRLVETMHGTITVDSQVGCGSTFTVLLPLEIPETEQANHE